MNVVITIEKTNALTFDMTEEQVSKMLASAFGANAASNTRTENVTHDDALHSPAEGNGSKPFFSRPEYFGSKVDRMFGSDWKKSCKQNPQQNSQHNNSEGYKGFLLIECPSCGKVKGFCTKTPIRRSFCDCGYEIELKDMRKAHLNCKCGKNWSYMTNISKNNFTHECLNCNSPIDVEYNPRRDMYETI